MRTREAGSMTVVGTRGWFGRFPRASSKGRPQEPSASRSMRDDLELALGHLLVPREVRDLRDVGGPQALTLGAAGDRRARPERLAADLDADDRVGPDVGEPGRLVGQAAVRADDHVPVAVAGIAERRDPRLARLRADGEEGHQQEVGPLAGPRVILPPYSHREVGEDPFVPGDLVGGPWHEQRSSRQVGSAQSPRCGTNGGCRAGEVFGPADDVDILMHLLDALMHANHRQDR